MPDMNGLKNLCVISSTEPRGVQSLPDRGLRRAEDVVAVADERLDPHDAD
jgi:hypothetical protein